MILKEIDKDTLLIKPENEEIEVPGSYFYGKLHYKNIIVGEGFKKICCSAFYKCDEVVSVKLCEGLEIIEDYAFEFCYGLKNISFPSTLKELGANIFYGHSRSILEIKYNGTSKEFIPFAKITSKIVEVKDNGPYDRYPYYLNQPPVYRTINEHRYFDQFCSECHVICNDGIVLKYGYSVKKSIRPE